MLYPSKLIGKATTRLKSRLVRKAQQLRKKNREEVAKAAEAVEIWGWPCPDQGVMSAANMMPTWVLGNESV